MQNRMMAAAQLFQATICLSASLLFASLAVLAVAMERLATGFSRLVGANRQDLADSRGLCGVVLGRNSTLQGEPARLQVRAGRPLGRWACRIVEPETRARQSGVQLMRKTVLLYIRLSRSTKNLSAGETSDTLGRRVGMHQPKQKLSCATTFVVW